MTHHTDADSAEFEKAWRERPIYMGGVHQKEVAYIWWMQAARRAPVAQVPQGWKLVPVEPTDAMLCALMQWDGETGLSILPQYQSMLAAAPQPPEAAPVQMPEPAEFQVRIRPTWNANYHWTIWEKCTPEAAADYERTPLLHEWKYEVRKLYTEQQVRQLLANHGIKEQST